MTRLVARLPVTQFIELLRVTPGLGDGAPAPG